MFLHLNSGVLAYFDPENLQLKPKSTFFFHFYVVNFLVQHVKVGYFSRIEEIFYIGKLSEDLSVLLSVQCILVLTTYIRQRTYG
jgi:hypothetical protein